MRLPQASEKSEQAAIVELLETVEALVWVLGTRRPKGDFPGTRQTPGLPDLFAVIPAQRLRGLRSSSSSAIAVWIEVKAKRGRLRPAQRDPREACLRANLVHLVGGVDCVLEFLRRGGWVK